MDTLKFMALSRRAEYLGEALENHRKEHEHHDESCERCKNIMNNGVRLLNDTPPVVVRFITITMWILHPIIMYRNGGSLSKVMENGR